MLGPQIMPIPRACFPFRLLDDNRPRWGLVKPDALLLEIFAQIRLDNFGYFGGEAQAHCWPGLLLDLVRIQHQSDSGGFTDQGVQLPDRDGLIRVYSDFPYLDSDHGLAMLSAISVYPIASR